jgi:spoIIIJ-associated protein
MEWVESTGASIAEAKERALDRLGVHEDDAEFEVVADVRSGLFGRVKEEARVRARVAPTTPPAKDDRRGRKRNRRKSGGGKGESKPAATGGGARSDDQGGGGGRSGGSRKDSGTGGGRGGARGCDRDQKSRSSSGDRGAERGASPVTPAARTSAASGGGTQEKKMDDETTMPLPQQADLAEEFVRGLAEQFGTAVTFERTEVDDDEIRITVSGDDLGRMIGRRGTTAAAIDDLVRTVLQRQAGSSRNGRIRVDVGGVRARRAEALAAFSVAQAAEVRASGTARALEPMSAADRKGVPDALVDEDGIDTVSEGEDTQRRVVIVPTATGD